MAIVAYVRVLHERSRALEAEKEALSWQAEEAKQRQKVEKELRGAEKEKYYGIIRDVDAKIAHGRMKEAKTLLWGTPDYLRGWEWGRLMYLCHQELLTLNPDSGTVTSVAFSPDGRRVATGGTDGTATVWDVEESRKLLTVGGHSGAVHSVAFSPDGKRLATASWDTTARIWDAETGGELLTLRGHSDDVSCVAFSPDGRRVLSGSSDKSVKIWDSFDTNLSLEELEGQVRQRYRRWLGKNL
jgi:WD40 repeat protein